ncbi:MAG: hypothetical protein AAFN12_10155, partial [Cyanobacteria bacterium J06560_2]
MANSSQPQKRLPEKILQVVPRIAPDMDGVGEYALRLSKRLKRNHEIDTAFLVIRPSDRTPTELEGFDVHSLRSHTVETFLAKVPSDVSVVVLQYSNYPYLQGKLDAPMWLGLAIRALKAKGILTVVMFHELPTLKYGVLRLPNPIQGRLSRELAKDADVVLTNNEAFQQTLVGWRCDGTVHCMPNFATIGEPDRVLPLAERDRAIVVFGSTDRRRVYQSNLPKLKEICQQLKIDTLYDVGRPFEWDAESLAAVKVVSTGMVSDSEASDLMSRSFAGVFDYHRFPRNLGKSTVYAAYCAHGLVPICNGRFLRPQDSTVANEHYVDTFTLHTRSRHPSSDDWLQKIATNANALYQTRSLSRCAQTYADLMHVSDPPLPVSSVT